MIRYLFMLCLFLLVGNSVYCQKTTDFTIPLNTDKAIAGRYSTIKVLDSRADTITMGIVQIGALNRKSKVVPKIPLTKQVNDLFKSLTDTKPNGNELFLQIRQFSFAEMSGGFSEKGYCYFRAVLYANKAGKYQKLNSIDTVLCSKSSIDVTDANLKSGSDIIAKYIGDNLMSEPTGTDYYSYNDILDIDSYEKRKLKLYNNSSYIDGLYLTYQSFRDQLPDKQITVTDGSDPGIWTIKAPGVDGKMEKVKSRKVYAIVYQGQPYIATQTDYYPLKKVGGDFLFTGKAKATAATGDVIIASAFFGIMGGLMASNTESTVEMKLDHINGGFIRLKEIIPPTYQEQQASQY
jgi:hypothetical protein